MILVLGIIYSIQKFRSDSHVFIKLVDTKTVLINNVIVRLNAEVVLTTRSSVDSQGGVYYDLIMRLDGKSFMFLEGVSKEETEYAKDVIASFFHQKAVSKAMVRVRTNHE